MLCLLKTVLLLTVFQTSCSFNLDTLGNNYLYYLRLNDTTSRFGYSVTLQRVQGETKLVVGAPYNVDRNGSVFHCNTDDQNNCREIQTARGGPNAEPGDTRQQMMGFSVSHASGKTLACAPLQHHKAGSWQQFRGGCSIMDQNFTEFATSAPCFKRDTFLKGYGFCNLGVSSTASSSAAEGTFIVGAPGAVNYKGAIFAITAQLKGQSTDFGTDKNIPVQVNQANAMFGYSVVYGKFTGNPRGDVAAGAPRSNNLQGSVFILNINENSFKVRDPVITMPEQDSQTGAYFGASVCAVDLNNDGRDDLLVGAPFYSKVRNEGKVYVFMNRLGTYVGLDRGPVLVGDSTEGGQFGLTIVNIGDLNGDGFSDVAIAAPFGGPDNNGAVYLYNGGTNGIRQPYSQVIRASTLQFAAKGFGYSISQAVDADGNGYPDLAIGSYLNGMVYLFRTKPVATLADNLQTNITAVPVDQSNCEKNNDEYHCIEFKINLRDTSPKGPDNFTVEVTIRLDDKKAIVQKERAFLEDQNNQLRSVTAENVTLTKGTISPLTKILFVKIGNNADDLLTDIEITTAYKTHYDNSPVCQSRLCPVMNIYGKMSSTIEITYERLCSQAICNTDLAISDQKIVLPSANEREIIFGSTQQFSLSMNVSNLGENAYQAMMRLNHSSDFKIDRILIANFPHQWTDIGSDATLRQIRFPLANPITKDSKLEVLVFFSLLSSYPSTPTYKFSMEASALGNDLNKTNNFAETEIAAKIQTCISISGSINQPFIFYNDPKILSRPPVAGINMSTAEIGTNFTQNFFISNNGRLDVNSLSVELTTLLFKENKEVVYIIDITANGVSCSDKVNPKNLLIPTTAPVTPIVITGNENESQKRKRRRKRRAVNDMNKQCTGSDCKTFKCHITRIEQGQQVHIKMITALVDDNLMKLQNKLTNMTSRIEVIFGGQHKDLHVQADHQNCGNLQHSLSWKLNPVAGESSSDDVEWWWILLAIVGTLMLLAIVCAILYRVGFFKRNRNFQELHQQELENQNVPNGKENGKLEVDEDE